MKKQLLLIVAFAVSALIFSACASVTAATPSESGEIDVVMTDYNFSPGTIRLKAGQTVSIVLRNDGEKLHEFMAGRNVLVHDDFTEGFEEDFFAGIDLEITGPGMVMGLPGMEMEGMDMGVEASMADMDMEDEHVEGDGMDMGDEHDETEADMEEMDMGDEHDDAEAGMEEMDMGDEHDDAEAGMEEMDMGDEHDEAEAGMEEMDMGDEHDEAEAGMEEMDMAEDDHDDHDEEGPSGAFGPFQLPEMDAHAGVMVMIDPVQAETMAGDVTIITFTIPESKIGTWEYGCFQERGQHYDDGMRGTIIVEG